MTGEDWIEADVEDAERNRAVADLARSLLTASKAKYSTVYAKCKEDIRFADGDSDNQAQWPDDILQDFNEQPCLTLNVVRQFNYQIINAAKLARSAMSVVGTGGGATKLSADGMNLLLQRTEYLSQADLVYGMAQRHQVKGGVGYWRIITDYLPGDTFEQELFLKPVPDPFMVWMDANSILEHGGDSNYAFVEERVPRSVFKARYPKWEELVSDPATRLLLDGDDEKSPDGDPIVGVLEFFRRVPKEYVLLSFVDPETGQRTVVREEMLPPESRKAVKALKTTRERSVMDWEVQWFKLVGDKVIDETMWPGRSIPLIRLVGEMEQIDGEVEIKGHTRAMKDAQRMFNYNASGQVTHVALQTKAPWSGPAEAIDGYEEFWKNTNVRNFNYLPTNHMDKDRQPIPQPQRVAPPQASPAFESGMSTAHNQMMMVSGQYQNQLGMMGNERTGAAIGKRQDQGDIATYHFTSNFEQALAWSSRLLIELYPRVYDTRRVLKVLRENDEEVSLEIDPSMQQIVQQRQGEDQQTAVMVLNPAQGIYDVRPSSGQSFASRRENTVQTMTMLLTQAPTLTGIIGDLLLDAMDFKEAREAATRMRRMVPAQAMGQGPSPQEQALQEQLKNLQGNLSKAIQENAKLQLRYEGRSQMRDIDAYKAQTDRIKALGDQLGLDPKVVVQIIEELGKDTAVTDLTPVVEANRDDLDQQTEGDPQGDAGGADPFGGVAPHPAAQQAPDGQWYLADPTKHGRFMRIGPLASKRSPPQ